MHNYVPPFTIDSAVDNFRPPSLITIYCVEHLGCAASQFERTDTMTTTANMSDRQATPHSFGEDEIRDTTDSTSPNRDDSSEELTEVSSTTLAG